MRWRLAILCGTLLALVLCSPASAANLRFRGCVDDHTPAQGPDSCSTSTKGMAGADGVAVSPDGRSVYVISYEDDAIVIFDRDKQTGKLKAQGCIDDNDSGADNCAKSVDGLEQPRSVIVSPDGHSVYVAASTPGPADAEITTFKRRANGSLAPQGCIEMVGGSDDCATTAPALAAARSLAITADGHWIYVGGVSTIASFHRTASGALTYFDCSKASISSEPCGGQIDEMGFESVDGIVAGGGGLVYAVTNKALFAFSGVGGLSSAFCVASPADAANYDCEQLVGMGDPKAIALGDRERSLYTFSDRVTGFAKIEGSGRLASPVFSPQLNPTPYSGGIVVGPRTGRVYAGDVATVARYRGSPSTGSLKVAGCLIDLDFGNGTGEPCSHDVNGLGATEYLAVSPDERSLYAVSYGDGAVVTIDTGVGHG
jgi:sugar lactone lactonase YvrE